MNPIGDHLKQFALALAVAAGLGVGGVQATTYTSTYDLGPSPTGTRIETGTGGFLPWITKGTLPAGSILRSVSVDAIIEAADYDSWASDINVYIDPSPEVPGTAALLQVGGYGKIGTVTKMIGWANGQNGPVSPVSDTKTAAAWSDLGDIDLNTVQLSIGNDYGPATWSGTISVTYYGPASIAAFGPGAVIDDTAKTIAWTVPYGTNLATLAPTFTLTSGTCVPASGVAPDFSTTNPATYTVTDGEVENIYAVTVTVAPGTSAGTTINVNLANVSGNTLDGTAYLTGGFAQAPVTYPGTVWNEATVSPDTQASLRDSEGNVTGLGFTTVSTTGAPNLTAPATSAGAPDVKLLTGFVGRVWNSSSGNTLHNRLTINGLDPAKTYNIYLASAHETPARCSWRIGAAGWPKTIANTTETRTAESWVAGDDYVVFYKIAPDVTGNILVYGQGTATGESNSGLTLNGFQVVDATGFLSPENDILTFGPGATITGTDIAWSLPYGTDVEHLVPTYTISSLASEDATYPSGTERNFTLPQTYTITAEDGTPKTYTVTVTVPATPEGLNVSTFDSTQGTSYLNPIANLMAVTPSATGVQVADINYGDFLSLPGITSLNTFAVLWEGWLDVTKDGAGDYTFGTASDDGSVVYLDLNGDGDFADPGELIVSNNNIQPTTVVTGTVALPLDSVHVVIGYFEDGGGEAMAARFNKGSGLAWDALQPINGTSGHFSMVQPAPGPPSARIVAFGDNVAGSKANIGLVVDNAAAIAWTVPYGTDLATLAPTFTLSSGATCDRTSGAIPSPDFSAGPVVYTVTSSDSLITNVYTVTVTVALPYIANWTFNDGTGADSSGNGHDLGGQSGPVITSPAGWGPSANCTSHGPGARDGFERYDGIPGDPLPTDNFTLGMYVKANNPAYSDGGGSSLFATTGGSGDGLWIGTRSIDGIDQWEIIVSGATLATFPVTPDTAQHIEVSRAAGSWYVMLDGAVVGTTSTNGFVWGSCHVGVNSGGGTGYSGLFGDITILSPAVSPTPAAKILGFGNNVVGSSAVIGPVIANAATIAWTVPYGTVLADLAPTFSLSSGATCDQTSGTIPTPDFSTGPVAYTVTSSDSLITNVYTVTVTVAPAPPPPPGGVTGLALWLDASAPDTMTLAGTSVNEWRDRLGSTVKMTSRGGSLPALVADGIGGIPTVHFNGSAWMNDSVDHSAPVTIFYVSRETGGSNARVLGACNNNWLMGYHGGQRNRFYFEGWVAGENDGIGAPSDTNPHLYAATIGGSGQNSTVWAEGVQLASNQNGVQGPNNLELNGYGNGGELSDCDISEVLVYNRVLTSNELDAVGGYLANKYNLDTAYPPPTPQAKIKTFGPGATVGPVVDNKADIAWIVPNGTNPATLTPTFTLSAGATCTVGGLTVTSGDPVDFTINPRHFIVTSSDLAIVNDYTVTVTEAPVETTLIWNAGSGAWDLSTPNWEGQLSGVLMPFFNGANVIFDKTAGGTVNIPAEVLPLSTTVSAISGTYTFSGGPLAGTGSLTKDGNGTLKIDGLVSGSGTVVQNTYSGGTIMNSGTLHLGAMFAGISPDCQGLLGTGPVTLNGGTIEFDRVTAENALTVSGGTLYATNGWGVNWNGPVTLNADLTVKSITYGGSMKFNGKISGTGGLILTGRDGVELNVANDYSGDTTVNNSSGAVTLTCNNVNALGSGALSISTGGAKVNLNYSGAKSISSLTLGGVLMTTPGTYGSLTSAATFKSAYFDGTGTVSYGDPASFAYITSFGTNVSGSSAAIGTVIANAAGIVWTVPYGTDLAALAPSFTLSDGATCDRISGTIPSPNFSAGPVDYTVTSSDSAIVNVYTVTVTVAPPPPGGTSVGPVCWYDAGEGVTTDGGGLILSWNDLSGYAHHGTSQNGNPALVAGQLNGKPAAQLRGQWLNLAGTFFAKEQYIVMRSPNANWSYYGGLLGRSSGRGSNYLTENGTTQFHSNQYPEGVSKNGTALASPFDLAPITDYMLVKIVVNNGDPNVTSYQIGRADGYSCDLDIVEIIGYNTELSTTDENLLGVYFATKYGLTIAEVPLSTACDITAFGTNILGSIASINTTSPTTGTITLTVVPGTTEEEVAALTPTYTLSSSATCDQPNGGSVPTPPLSTTGSVPYKVIAEDGVTTKTYSVTVIVGTAPPNDNFADAINLPGASGTQTGTGTVFATFQAGEPTCVYPATTNTVWFKWTAPADGGFTVRTLGSTNLTGGEWDACVGIYTGSAVDALTAVPPTPQDTGVPETVTVAVTAGTTYHIQLGGWPNPAPDAAANIVLNWSFVASAGPISVGASGSGTLAFDELPNASQWSTLAVAGGSGDLTNDGDLDTAMGGIDAASITGTLASQAGSGTSATAYWRSDDQKLGTQPTGNAMTLLMATLQNTSGSTMDSLPVSYTMGMPTVTPGEDIKGHRVYWSMTGAAGTWTAVGDYLLTVAGTTLNVSFELASLAWANGDLLYVVWADDNGATNPDGDYTIDDVSFGNAGGGYAAWAVANAGGQAANLDYNHDGVANGIAYFMGATGIATNPGVVGGTVTWPMSATFSGSYEVQTSPDLATWTNVSPRPTPAGGDLTYTLPAGAGKLFVRLLVTPTP